MLSRELTATPQMVVTEANDPTGATPGSPAAIALNPRVVEAQRALDELLITRTDSHPDVVLARKHLEEIRASVAKEAAELASQTAAAAAATGVGPDLSAVKPGAKGKANADSASPPLKPGAKGKADAVSTSPPLSPGTKGKADVGTQKPAANTHEVPNPVYEQLKVRMFETESTLSSLQRQLADATRERDRMDEIARGAPGLQAEYINLNRDYDVLESNYKGLLGRREEMRIGQAANASADKIKMQVIDPPQVPQNPVAPKRSLMLTAVLALGVAGGAALAGLLTQLDQSFHTIDELRDLGYPVVGGISLLNTTVTRGRLASAFAFGMALVLLGGLYLGLLYRLAHTPGIA